MTTEEQATVRPFDEGCICPTHGYTEGCSVHERIIVRRGPAPEETAQRLAPVGMVLCPCRRNEHMFGARFVNEFVAEHGRWPDCGNEAWYARLDAEAAEKTKAEEAGMRFFIRFEGHPSRDSARFVELETEAGRSIGPETSGAHWYLQEDGTWLLGPFAYAPPAPEETVETTDRDYQLRLAAVRIKILVDRMQGRDAVDGRLGDPAAHTLSIEEAGAWLSDMAAAGWPPVLNHEPPAPEPAGEAEEGFGTTTDMNCQTCGAMLEWTCPHGPHTAPSPGTPGLTEADEITRHLNEARQFVLDGMTDDEANVYLAQFEYWVERAARRPLEQALREVEAMDEAEEPECVECGHLNEWHMRSGCLSEGCQCRLNQVPTPSSGTPGLTEARAWEALTEVLRTEPYNTTARLEARRKFVDAIEREARRPLDQALREIMALSPGDAAINAILIADRALGAVGGAEEDGK